MTFLDNGTTLFVITDTMTANVYTRMMNELVLLTFMNGIEVPCFNTITLNTRHLYARCVRVCMLSFSMTVVSEDEVVQL